MLSRKCFASNCKNRMFFSWSNFTQILAEVKLFHRPGSYQFSFALFVFPFCVWSFLAFLVFFFYSLIYFAAALLSLSLYNITSFPPQYIFLYWHLLCFEETTKKKGYCQSISSLVNLKLSWITLYFVDLIGNLYTGDINIFEHIGHIGVFVGELETGKQ